MDNDNQFGRWVEMLKFKKFSNLVRNVCEDIGCDLFAEGNCVFYYLLDSLAYG